MVLSEGCPAAGTVARAVAVISSASWPPLTGSAPPVQDAKRRPGKDGDGRAGDEVDRGQRLGAEQFP
jgi:hypothetical protein